jgi:transcriptional regulator with XRE-family HTH domain
MEEIGKKIKKIRKNKNLTIRKLASLVGCSNGYISQLEKGDVTPSITILKKISNTLGMRLVDFFLEEQDEETIVIRKNDRFEIRYPQSDASIFMLTKHLTGRSMEPLLARFEPGAGSRGQYSHGQGGEEFGYVISGQLHLIVDDKEYILEEGDSFYFKSTKPHGYTNKSDRLSEVIWVISPPTY